MEPVHGVSRLLIQFDGKADVFPQLAVSAIAGDEDISRNPLVLSVAAGLQRDNPIAFANRPNDGGIETGGNLDADLPGSWKSERSPGCDMSAPSSFPDGSATCLRPKSMRLSTPVRASPRSTNVDKRSVGSSTGITDGPISSPRNSRSKSGWRSSTSHPSRSRRAGRRASSRPVRRRQSQPDGS